jgi:hypothetical protein
MQAVTTIGLLAGYTIDTHESEFSEATAVIPCDQLRCGLSAMSTAYLIASPRPQASKSGHASLACIECSRDKPWLAY